MMNNLFSVFDPSSSMLVLPNWLGAMVIIAVPSIYWLAPNYFNVAVTAMKFTLYNEMKTLLGHTNKPGSTLTLLMLFLVILVNNFMGLFPYVFTASSHMSITMSMALPLWLAFLVYGWVNHTKEMFAHLVPQGTPVALMSFMVLIESVSNLIRPVTLSIRLAANTIAGHLLLTLLGNLTASIGASLLPTLLLTQMALLTLESAVAIIQAYVFMVLITLYSSESMAH